MRNRHWFKHFGLLRPLKAWFHIITFTVPLVMIACGDAGQMNIQQYKAANAQSEQSGQTKLDKYITNLQQASNGNSAEDQDYANSLQEQKLAQTSAKQGVGKTEIQNDGDDGGGDTSAAALAALIPNALKAAAKDVLTSAKDFLDNLAPPEPQFSTAGDQPAADQSTKDAAASAAAVLPIPVQPGQQAQIAPTTSTTTATGASADPANTTMPQKPKGIITTIVNWVSGVFSSKPKPKPTTDDSNTSANANASPVPTAPVIVTPVTAPPVQATPTINPSSNTAAATNASPTAAPAVPEALAPVVPEETPESLEQLDYKNPNCANKNFSCLSPYGRRIKQAYGFYGTIIGHPDHNTGGRLHDAAELDANGPGFHQKTDSRASRYGTDQLIAFVQGLAKDVSAKNLTHELVIGDLSRLGGGFSGHQGHQNGLDVDVSFIHTNSVPDHFQDDVVKDVIQSEFALEKNWQMVQDAVRTHWIYEIFVHKAVKDAFCNLAKKSANPSDYDEVLSAIRPEKSHTNHFHMRLKCPITSPCTPEPNLPNTTGCGK